MKQRARKASAPAFESVDAYLASLEEGQRQAVEALRNVILDSDPSISEGIKWNVPSFRTSEYFATVNMRAKAGLGVVLHFGAKRNRISETGVTIPDPESLLEWLAADRAMVTFRNLDELADKHRAFQTLIREWIRHVEGEPSRSLPSSRG